MSVGHLNTYQFASMPFPDGQKTSLHPSPPSTADETRGDGPALVAAQARASRKRVALTTCLATTLILGSLLGTSTFLLAYLCAIHQCQLSSRSVISTASLGKVLTITQITSHIAPISIPILMGLFSYFLSAEWLRSSLDDGPNRPTPRQLGLLLSICNGANIKSFLSALKYVMLNKSTDKAKNLAPAPILRQSILVLGSLLVISYVAAGADTWLHASSTTTIISSNSAYVSAASSDFGRKINETMCQMASLHNDGLLTGQMVAASCGMLNMGSAGNGPTFAEGLRVVSNTSNLHRVELTDDQTAILVPQSLPSNVTYAARTLGVKTQCTTITKQCIFETDIGWGLESRLNLNCSRAGIKYGNATDLPSLCALDDQGYCIDGVLISSNPFNAAEVVASSAYLSPDQEPDTFINNTGWFIHGSPGAWDVVFCNVTALDVNYIYASSKFLLQSAIPKSIDEAQHMMAAGFWGRTSAISQAVDGAGLETNTTYEQAYSMEVSRQMLARGALLYEPTSVTRIQSENRIIGSKLQLPPLVLFVAALLVFICQIIWISVRIAVATWNVQYVSLAALHIKSPLAMVQRSYGHMDPVLTWETDAEKRFGTETNLDRLRVGPVILDDRVLSSAFIVTKG